MAHVIVQLSDIHISLDRKIHPILSKTEAICAALRSVLQPGDDCFIVFCGDSANCGKTEEYRIVQDWILQLATLLSEHMLGRYPNLVFVPGNHDVDFDLNDSVRDLVLKSQMAGEAIDARQNNECLIPQAPFRQFVSELGGLLSVQAAAGTVDSKTYDAGDHKLTFHLLNSALYSQKEEKPSTLGFPVDDLIECLSSNPHSADINISVVHHPYNWLLPTKASSLRQVLESNCDIILTGHEHEGSVYSKDRGGTEQNLYLEGGVLQDYKHPDASSFNVTRIDPAREAFKCWTFRWSRNAYDTDLDGVEHKFVRLRQPLRHEFQLIDSWSKWLDYLGTDLRHPRVPSLKLEDVFIYPDFRRVDISRSGAHTGQTVYGRELVSFIKDKKRVLITGTEKTGKTCLSKRLFVDLRDAGFVPLLLRREFSVVETKNIDEAERMRRSLSKVYASEYATPDHGRYWQTKVSDRAIIIDDYHKLGLGSSGREIFLEWLDKSFGIVIVFGDSGLPIRELLDANQTDRKLWGYDKIDILECGRRARFELVKKWVNLGVDVFDNSDRDAYQKTVEAQQVIDNLICRNMVPSLPMFILMMLQQLERKTDLGGSTGLYGHLYEMIIKDWIIQISKDGPDLDAKLNYLSELANFVWERGTRTLSESEFATWHAQYCADYHIMFPRDRLFAELEEIGVLAKSDEHIRFRRRYYANFFVARYIAQHIDKPAIAGRIPALCRGLHLRDTSSIMMFLCHLSKARVILDAVLTTANEHFAAAAQYDLSRAPDVLPEADFLPSRLALVQGDPATHREQMLEDADRVDRHTSLAERDGEDDFDQEVPELIAKINAAQNSLQLCGQILRNHYGSMKGADQIELIETCFGVGLRTLTGILSELEEHKEIIAQSVATIMKQKHPQWDDMAIDKRTRESIQFLAVAIGYGLVKHTSYAVGVPRLKMSFQKIEDDAATTFSHRMVVASAKLDFFEGFPKSDVFGLQKVISKNTFSTEILRLLVWQHLHLFHVDPGVRDEVCAKLSIDATHPMLLDPTEKKALHS